MINDFSKWIHSRMRCNKSGFASNFLSTTHPLKRGGFDKEFLLNSLSVKHPSNPPSKASGFAMGLLSFPRRHQNADKIYTFFSINSKHYSTSCIYCLVRTIF